MRSSDSGMVNLKGWPAAWCGVGCRLCGNMAPAAAGLPRSAAHAPRGSGGGGGAQCPRRGDILGPLSLSFRGGARDGHGRSGTRRDGTGPAPTGRSPAGLAVRSSSREPRGAGGSSASRVPASGEIRAAGSGEHGTVTGWGGEGKSPGKAALLPGVGGGSGHGQPAGRRAREGGGTTRRRKGARGGSAQPAPAGAAPAAHARRAEPGDAGGCPGQKERGTEPPAPSGKKKKKKD